MILGIMCVTFSIVKLKGVSRNIMFILLPRAAKDLQRDLQNDPGSEL